jgi:hypothetical protein
MREAEYAAERLLREPLESEVQAKAEAEIEPDMRSLNTRRSEARLLAQAEKADAVFLVNVKKASSIEGIYFRYKYYRRRYWGHLAMTNGEDPTDAGFRESLGLSEHNIQYPREECYCYREQGRG